MSLRKQLASGELGIELVIPRQLEMREETADLLRGLDPETATEWFVFFGRGVRLDLGEDHRDGLASAMEHYARAMFEQLSAQLNPAATPRTVDPAWAVMVDIEPQRIDGAAALRTVHRMSYQAGNETVMGHLLVPVRDGLFEIRIIGVDRMTGLREAMLIDEALAASRGPDGRGDLPSDWRPPGQAYFDDPQLDARFPDNALSRVRAALRSAAGDGSLRVLRPPRSTAGAEVELGRLGCALRPPPRFVQTTEDERDAMFVRTSFCVHDGDETFLVNRDPSAARDPGGLGRHAERTTTRIHEESGVTGLVVEVQELEAINGRAQVLVVAEGLGHRGRLRNVFRWFADDGGQVWYVAISATPAVPTAVRSAELDGAARSWRAIPIAVPRRPWWKIW